MQFKSLFPLASILAISLGCSTVQDVLNDLATVKASALSLNNTINFSPTSFLVFVEIHTNITGTTGAVNKTTGDAQDLPLPISESDGTSILNALSDIKTVIADCITGLVSKKPAIDALPVTGVDTVIDIDLTALNASVSALEGVLIAEFPADLLPATTALRNEFDAVLETGITAYAV